MEENKKVYRSITIESDEQVLKDIILLPGDRLNLTIRSEHFVRLRILGTELSIEPAFVNRSGFIDEEVNIGS